MTATIIRPESFAPEVTAWILNEAREAIAERGLFRLSLCGGGTPKPVYAALAEADLPWEKVQITFGDERSVPPDHEQSNYRMAHEALLGKISIPEGNIFRMRGELPPAEAAADYERRLKAVAERLGEPRYVHDLLLLGMGDDGHTASLFPETTALQQTERSVVANHVPKLETDRITFTYPLINAARTVAFLVNDPKKEPIVQQVLAKSGGYPSEGVAPASGRLFWFLGNGQ